MSHTPGKWVAIKGIDDDAERWGVYTEGPQHFHLATIENGAPGDTLETEGHNARLIAAAPALLEALKKAVELIRLWHGMNIDKRLEPRGWRLYFDSPEMKIIRQALTMEEDV